MIRRALCALLLAVLAGSAAAADGCPGRWLSDGGIGMSTHYFALDAQRRDEVAAALDVGALAEQAGQVGAAWLIFTLQHQNWIPMAPSEAFAARVGSRGFMTRRDLPAALIPELQRRGIALILYLNLRLDPGSNADPAVRAGMGPWPPDDRTIDNVAAVYREYALRYGRGVAGWWLDGAGLPEYGAAPQRERWFATLAAALRAGNPDAMVAFSPGVALRRYSSQDDYTAGESDLLPPPPRERCLDGAQWHAWTYVGGWWGSDGSRFDDQRLCRFAGAVLAAGGALTLDLGTWGVARDGLHGATQPVRDGGRADPAQVAQLARIFRRGSPRGPLQCG
jgi:hypothetical protein